MRIKDRVIEPVSKFLESINKITEEVELIISDFNSKDKSIHETMAKHITNIPYKIIDMGDEQFDLAKGLNASYKASTGNHLLFTDADICIRNKSIRKGIELLKEDKAYFPIVFGFSSLDTKKGLWCINDYKTVMINKDIFEKLGLWQKNDERGAIIFRNCRGKVPSSKIIREKDRGLLHHWHPKTNKNIWTKRK